jgi:hypothetical protein
MRVAFMAHRISQGGPTLAALSLYPHLVTMQSMEDRFYGTLFINIGMYFVSVGVEYASLIARVQIAPPSKCSKIPPWH